MTTTRDAYESSTKSVVREDLSPTRAVSDHLHRRTADEAAGKLVGDVDFDAAEPIVGAITPVPGGVGAVTTAILAKHVIEAAERASK